VNASFSSQFHALSKLVIVALMVRGRHRGLPRAIDKAIEIPGGKDLDGNETTTEQEEEGRRKSGAKVFSRRSDVYSLRSMH